MKKIIALVLALTMAFSMALTVSAAKDTADLGTDIPDNTNKSFEVKITINGQAITQYAFDVIYGDMSFTYSDSLEWNPETYEYVPSDKEGVWKTGENGNIIQIVNHSDAPIWCAAKATDVTTAYGDIKLAVSEGGQIAACVVNDTEIHALTMTVTVEGAPKVPSATAAKLGTVVVTISDSEIVETPAA